MNNDSNFTESFDTKERIPNNSSFEQKKPNYWKYGFFLMLLLLVMSNGILLFRETKKRVKTTNSIENTTHPTQESPVVATPSTSNIPKSQFTLKLPNDWSSELPVNGVIHDKNDEKIGEIEGIKTYENSCLSYFGKRFSDGGMENKLGQWTQKIGEKTWYVAHIDTPCLGECNWNVYCVEGENKIFSVYLDNNLAKNNSNLIDETLSTFLFNY
ncbi:hypothetical protein KKD03_05240 [Patescibacteria group bacterium]|nr:hypothetical protein [Patescibacteria group bacterium]